MRGVLALLDLIPLAAGDAHMTECTVSLVRAATSIPGCVLGPARLEGPARLVLLNDEIVGVTG